MIMKSRTKCPRFLLLERHSTYYQVIAKNIKDNNQYETLFHKLSEKTNKS